MSKVFSRAALRAQRRAHHLSVEQLAAAAGISYGGLIKIERGETQPTFRTITMLVSALPGTTFDDLLVDDDIRVGAR